VTVQKDKNCDLNEVMMDISLPITVMLMSNVYHDS